MGRSPPAEVAEQRAMVLADLSPDEFVDALGSDDILPDTRADSVGARWARTERGAGLLWKPMSHAS
jgi:hypothetical protein